MAALPILSSVIAACVVWLARKRLARTQWILSMALAAGIWILLLLLSLRLPGTLQISVWRPEDLFPSSLSLSMDRIAWAFVYASGTLLMSMIFTAAVRPGEAPAGVRAFWFLYTALAMLAMMGENMMTLAIAWSSMDVLTWWFLLRLADGEQERARVLSRALADAIGVLLLLAASILPEVGQDPSIAEAVAHPQSAALLLLSVIIRLGLVPLHLEMAPVAQLRRGLGTLLRIYPPGVALVLLARIFDVGLPPETLPWIQGIGIVFALLGSLRWLIQRDAIEARPYWILGMTGLALLLAEKTGGGGSDVMALGVLVLLMGGAISLFELVSPTHRALPVLMGLLIAGPPLTPAGVLMGGVGSNILLGEASALQVIAMICTALLALGCLHLLFQPAADWPTSEALVRITYDLGMILPILTLVGLGLWIGAEASLQAALSFGVELFLGGLIFLGLRRLHPRFIERSRAWIDVVNPAGLEKGLVWLARGASSLVAPIAQLFEGESAMLWMYVIIVMILLTVG